MVIIKSILRLLTLIGLMTLIPAILYFIVTGKYYFDLFDWIDDIDKTI